MYVELSNQNIILVNIHMLRITVKISFKYLMYLFFTIYFVLKCMNHSISGIKSESVCTARGCKYEFSGLNAKVLSLVYVKLETNGCWVGTRTGASVTATPRV